MYVYSPGPNLQGVQSSLREVYSRLRQEAQRTQGMPIAVRHLESMIRMSEAHARMHLRDRVEEADVAAAVRVMINSFVSTQVRTCRRSTLPVSLAENGGCSQKTGWDWVMVCHSHMPSSSLGWFFKDMMSVS
jgi:DNA replicative helicase MCM subunit Mcm2 (Cdc46/Mcm family)